MSEVAVVCGEPLFRNVREIATETEVVSGDGTVSKVTVQVEDWTYNCGPRFFMKTLSFQGGILISVTLGERGTEENSINCW